MQKILLFGFPHVEQDGIKLQISRRKSLAILAYLAVTGRPQSRDVLATLCYPEFDQSSARNNLRRDIFELQTSTGRHTLRSERDQVSLNPDVNLWVDVNEFQAYVDRVRQHHHLLEGHVQEPLCDDCQAGLTAAVALYSADFMAGFNLPGSREFEEWQFFQAENLRQSLAEALQLLIGWHSERGEFETGIGYGRRWLALDRLHEPAQRQLTRLYAEAGQQAAALRQYREWVRLLHDELGLEPEEETIALYEAILSKQLPSRSPGKPAETRLASMTSGSGQVRHNLPYQDAAITGRESELQQIIGYLRDEPACRLLTLLGPGGIGKTRLAIEAASRLADDLDCPFCDGIWFVSLAGFSQVDAIIPAIADTIALPLTPDPKQRHQQLLDYLQRRRLLLVLDNFEHLVEPASIQLLVDILDHALKVKLLVTSRMRLKAHSEQSFQVRALDVPGPEAEAKNQTVEQTIARYSAVQLFAQHARRVKPDFSISANNLEQVIELCRLVEGMPLGIELAAAWLEALTPGEVVTEVTRSLDFLAASWPDRPERQHSLRAIFDSSWRLLVEAERNALISLTSFQGSFTRQAAQGVSGVSIQTLLALQNKSWLQYNNDGRYQIHELLRQYGSEKLSSDPAAWEHVRKNFANYYAAFLQELGEKTKGADQNSAFEAIGMELENIRLAWQIAVEGGNIELAVDKMMFCLYRYAELRQKFFDIKALLDLAIQEIGKNTQAAVNPHILPALLSVEASFDPYGRSRYGRVYLPPGQKEVIRRAWELSRGDIETLKEMGYWGILLCFQGCWVDSQQAVVNLRELGSFFREQDCRWELAYALSCLAAFYLEAGLHSNQPIMFTTVEEETRQLLGEALKIFRDSGDVYEGIQIQQHLGVFCYIQGDYREAIAHFQTTLAELEYVGDVNHTYSILSGIGSSYFKMGDFGAAFEYLKLSRQKMADIGDKTGVAHCLSDESLIASRYSNLEHARQTRLECLAVYQELHSAEGVAWATWEIGELERLSGDLADAREWFEKARYLFESLDDRTSLAFYERGLGDIAQMSGDYTGAKKHFQESLQQATGTGHHWAFVYALCGLGRAEVALGEVEAAQGRFSEAIKLAGQINYPDLTLISLAGFADLLAALGDEEQAVELGSLVSNHKLSWNETKAQMVALLHSLHSLPPDRFAAAQERGRCLEVTEAIARFAH